MAHLIQPITIDSVAYCCSCQGGRSTQGVLTQNHANPNGATISNLCSPWVLFTGGESDDEGEVSFGVSCGTDVEIEFTSTEYTDSDYTVDIGIYIQGVLDQTISLSETNTSETVSFTVISGPCGEVVTIYCFPVGGFEPFNVDVEAEVLSIT